LAGLLTYSPFARPSHPEQIRKVANEWAMVMELTAAGQLRIYTVFPFNLLMLVQQKNRESGANLINLLTLQT